MIILIILIVYRNKQCTVTVYENNALQENVASYLLEFNYDCYCYINTDLSPKQNTTYRLEVEADGYPRCIRHR